MSGIKPESRRTKALLIGIGYKPRASDGASRATTLSAVSTNLTECSYESSAVSYISYASTQDPSPGAVASDRPSWEVLDGPSRDIQHIYSSMRKSWPYRDVHMLTDEKEEWRQSVSRANIIKELKWLVEGAQPGDRLFFYYSGHGSQRPTRSPTEDDGKDEAMVPGDCVFPALRDGKILAPCEIDCPCPPGASYCWKQTYKGMIRDNEFHDILVKNLNGAKLLAIFDCCHSGTIMDLKFQYTHSDGEQPEIKRKSLRKRQPRPVEGTEKKLLPKSIHSLALGASLSATGIALDGGTSNLNRNRPDITLDIGTSTILDGPVYETPIEDYQPAESGVRRRISHVLRDAYKETQTPGAGGKVVTISACCDDQLVFEMKTSFKRSPETSVSQGLLTYAFLQAIGERNTLTRRELIERMTEIFEEETYKRRELLRKEQRQYFDSRSSALLPAVFNAEEKHSKDHSELMKHLAELGSRPFVPVLSSTHSLNMDVNFKL